ncbi:MAG: hypothetical protein H5T76_04255 [Streptomyces sp.]|nr:hypothetical protein [Streptomyces sp.]
MGTSTDGDVLVRSLAGVVVAAVAGWVAAIAWWGVGPMSVLPALAGPAVSLLLLLGGLLLALRVAGSFQVPGWGVLVLATALVLGLLGTGWVVSGQRDLLGLGQLVIMYLAPFVLGAAWLVGLVMRAGLERRGVDPLP